MAAVCIPEMLTTYTIPQHSCNCSYRIPPSVYAELKQHASYEKSRKTFQVQLKEFNVQTDFHYTAALNMQ